MEEYIAKGNIATARPFVGALFFFKIRLQLIEFQITSNTPTVIAIGK